MCRYLFLEELQRVNGYKWHVFHDVDSGLICAVGIAPTNVTEAISEDTA